MCQDRGSPQVGLWVVRCLLHDWTKKPKTVHWETIHAGWPIRSGVAEAGAHIVRR